MEFEFPPLPLEYTRVHVARWLCLIWTLLALGWLMSKFVRSKAIRGTDAWVWVGFLVVAALLSCAGFGWYVQNGWLVPLMLTNMAIGVPFTGLMLTLICRGRKASIGGIALSLGISLCCVTAAQPAPVNAARESARRTQCKNDLKQIGVALRNHEETHQRWLPPVVREEPPVSWRVSILPYLNQASLYAQYEHGLAWDKPPNKAMASQKMSGYVCLSNSRPQDEQGRWYTAYSMPTGPHTVGANPTETTIKDITDGTSNTLLVVEACGAQIIWTEPREVDVSVQPTGINLKGNAPGHSTGWLSSYHAGGTQALMADGSVRFVSEKTDPALLQKLATVDGGEEVGDY